MTSIKYFLNFIYFSREQKIERTVYRSWETEKPRTSGKIARKHTKPNSKTKEKTTTKNVTTLTKNVSRTNEVRMWYFSKVYYIQTKKEKKIQKQNKKPKKYKNQKKSMAKYPIKGILTEQNNFLLKPKRISYKTKLK